LSGAFDLKIDRAIGDLGPNDGLKEGEGLVVAPLVEEQLSERHPSLGQQNEILRGDGGVDGITERGLGELFLSSSEQLPSPLDVFEGLHGKGHPPEGPEADTGRARGECGIPEHMDDSRLMELELRYMQQGELLQQLNDVLYAQQQELDALRTEVELLKRKLEGEPGLVDARQQERPPHY
jgi:SlyX protein